MPNDDLMEHANSTFDYYELLGVNFETSESDIRRAYRRTALKYHPDKNQGNTAAIEKFHLLQIAYDVLSDATAKAVYDNARRARKEKQERDSAFEGRRRQMKEDLERRESGFFKRKRDEEDEEALLQREIKRLAEDGAKRRREREEMLNREKLEEEERLDREQNGASNKSEVKPETTKGGTDVPDIDRSVKVRWIKDTDISMTEDALASLFARFGKVERALLLKEKRKKIDSQKEKVTVATGIVVFASVVGAHAAVEDSKKQSDHEFSKFDSVYWASDAEPQFLQNMRQKASSPAMNETPSTPSTPTSQAPKRRFHIPEGGSLPPNTPLKETGAGNLRKVPSFASFSGTPKSSSKPEINGTPSREELVMIRLRNADKKRQEEKRRLEEQIRQNESTPAGDGEA